MIARQERALLDGVFAFKTFRTHKQPFKCVLCSLDQFESLEIAVGPCCVIKQRLEEFRAIGLARMVVDDNSLPTAAMYVLHEASRCPATILVDPPVFLKSTNQFICRYRLQLVPNAS